MSGGLMRKGAWFAAACVLAIAAYYIARSPIAARFSLPLEPSVVAQPVGDLPNMPEKPVPQSYVLDGCPPEGRGGDPQLNVLKNRSDSAEYVPVSFDSLTSLTWPKSVEGLAMAQWPLSGRQFIEQYAGTPVSVEGYIANARDAAPDPATCSWTNSSYLDWHLTFTKNPRDARPQGVLVEVTPRVRMLHFWTMDVIHSLLIDDHVRVRISGWLYFDPEHAGDVGVTRSTLWEINPVMQIQVLDKNRWVPLESFSR